MGKRVFEYYKACFLYSVKPSWQSALGILGGLVFIWLAGEPIAERVRSFPLFVGHPRMTAAVLFLAAVGLSFLLALVMRIVFVAPYKLYRAEKDATKKAHSDLENIKDMADVFDWSAKETAEYVMHGLGKDLDATNQFVMQMFSERELKMRAFPDRQPIDVPVPAGTFDSDVLHLMGTANLRVSSKTWGLPYSDEGWIQPKTFTGTDFKMTFRAPRFMSREIRAVVTRYEQSRPIVPDFPLGAALARIQFRMGWATTSDEQIRKMVTDFACNKKLTIWGQPGSKELSIKLIVDTLIEIPFHFFYDVKGGPDPDRGYFLERFQDHPDSSQVTKYKCIYQVTVNRGQIDSLFS